jgi:hypothetical protein
MLGKITVGVVLAALAVYGLIEALPLILGPSLVVDSPISGQTVPLGILTVTGEVKRVTALTLDGAPLLPDEKGAFSSTLAFPAGTSILTFTASDRFGRKITTTRTIYVPN